MGRRKMEIWKMKLNGRVIAIFISSGISLFGIIDKNMALAILPLLGMGAWFLLGRPASKSDARFDDRKLYLTDENGQVEIKKGDIAKIEARNSGKMTTYMIHFNHPIHAKNEMTFRDPEFEKSFYPAKYIFTNNLYPALNKMIEFGIYEPKEGELGFELSQTIRRKAIR
jgi:hypothetical protein